MSTSYASLSAPQSAIHEFKRASVLGLSFSLGSYHQIQEAIIAAARRKESRMACLANVHMTVEATNDPVFGEVVNGADWVATDGMPLTWALRLLHGIQQERVAGFDLFSDLIRRAAEENLSIFFYGSTPKMLDEVVGKCGELYPSLDVAGSLSPPFRPLTEHEQEDVIAHINNSGAQLVFVALGCPKQERWMQQMRGKIQAVMVGVGGALPIFTGTQGRSPNWMRNAGLEWAHRLAMEPRRLFKRYAITNSLFIIRLARQLLSQ
ncbi:WecB/TagA/CpsF family glycosyltransferase [Spirosoma fluviale]|uniref:N-acetylglucosaminyldiphosphoundecaprenol N-acetyl-beta-D-mannosaminyltransferase n=1 Tax=Spirosoma fluviale TaxID=1597977 RepID=A0A286GWE0_9BACT|nr:WecB/TagA/CpsF family glycosyltransferase [Spirosoma fluviale]SOD99821.1 N-acetylglucosaminyldiphosphoundecaprenol N-acetyl-beta-D-mannosaminyltransferase [Spirosoma fluviale]